jgi:DNA-binding CsgD family transcriptional regulator
VEGAFLERSRAVEAGLAVIDATAGGSGRAHFYVGEAGLGKTSLLLRAQEAAGKRVALATGRGEAMEAVLPFGLLAQVMSAVGPTPASLPVPLFEPVVEPATPHHRVLRHLQSMRGRQVVFLLDDLHWADRDSLEVICFLARRLGSLPVGIIGALRPWPEDAYEAVRRLVAAGDATMERLQPLSRPASSMLLASLQGTDVDPAVEAQSWALCRGNPLLVEQLVLALARGEALSKSSAGDPALPDHILLTRFAALDRTTLTYARAASVHGRTFYPDITAAVTELSVTEVDRALEVLGRTGLVEDGPGSALAFVHPVLAQVLHDDLGSAARRRLHTRYVDVLIERGLDNEAAEHALRSSEPGDQKASALLERTGRAALAAGSVATAIRHLEGAVQILGDRTPGALRLVLAQALASSGRMGDAASECERLLAAADLDWQQRVAALRLRGRSLYFTGSPVDGDMALSQAAAVAEANDVSAAIEPLLDQSLCAWLSVGPVGALPLAARARSLAVDAGERLREMAGATWGHLAYESGDPRGLAATAPLGQRLLGGNTGTLLDPFELAWPWAPAYQYAMNANYAGHYEEAHHAFTVAADALERAGAVNAMATVAVHLAAVAVRQGRLTDALEHASRAEEFGDLTPTVMPFARLARAEALLWSGRFDESEACCQLADEHAGSLWFVRVWVGYLRGARTLWQGSPSASDQFLVVEETSHTAGIGDPCHVMWQPHAVAAHLAAGRMEDAERVAGWLEAAAVRLPCAWPAAGACLARAQIDDAMARQDAAEAGYRSAVSMLEGTPLVRAETLLALGRVLRHRRNAVAARSHLADAAWLAQSCGAAHLADAARRELAAAGGRQRRRTTDASRLTPAELRVAREAAAGRSNADIARALYLSVHTVESHLKRAYAKLGIRSRTELVGELLADHDEAR